ncbi:conserved hypothetical protein [Perkinsus marinus ATCC 50983]|uniref:Uncharacterized protein n=1 Tax=Perkinsus marinus (strain ATCC 50983 / TXsc) TaxID=423536 RepID=C5K5X7_PERM5|nr:conserved hypothetical protein [Perkinsus marinus ATCC 50983]XP_002788342.1 conserved hypothetical protein [Perkinsus marinus ATCC 50983]EER17479.1 conserved hypothetical protein [Perkinsus marinus ATCC 50983]EER20138.1 conserved hypothetical protein [Perkinsus marinus ATCC 50983]|eukprot:XP_002785683.1 conserved hypothetical protein [Perkinsus marinus ATCC 50983]
MAAPPIENMGAVAPLIFVIALLCMPSGIGGGVLFVPVLRLIGKVPLKEATALSQALIASASLAAILFNFFEQYRARNESKALIVWPFVILIIPCTVIGSLIGVYIFSWLPSLFILILYFCYACLGSFMACKKGIKLWKAETRAKRQIPVGDSTDSSRSSEVAQEIPPLLEMPNRKKLIAYTSIVALIWAVCLIFPPLKGNSATQKRSPGAVKIGLVLMTSTIVIGLLSSIIGTAGALFIIRVVLSLGLDPKQATATATVVIFATSSRTALSFALGGYFPPASNLWIVVLPFAGALLGKTIVAKLIAKTGRLSILVLLLAAMVAIGGIITISTGIISAVNDARNGEDVAQFGNFC